MCVPVLQWELRRPLCIMIVCITVVLVVDECLEILGIRVRKIVSVVFWQLWTHSGIVLPCSACLSLLTPEGCWASRVHW